MAQINSTKDMLLMKLQVLYDIEKEIEGALPKMEKAANNMELKELFSTHLDETMEHSKRLEQAFEFLDEKPKKMKAEGIRGIIADGESAISADTSPEIKDLMLASAARYVEHYEMAGYLSAIEEATTMGLDDIQELLSETLDEENTADDNLTMFMKDNLDMASEGAMGMEREEASK